MSTHFFFDGANEIPCRIVARFPLVGDVLLQMPDGKFLSVSENNVHEIEVQNQAE